jgi:hypothetical protein
MIDFHLLKEQQVTSEGAAGRVTTNAGADLLAAE